VVEEIRSNDETSIHEAFGRKATALVTNLTQELAIVSNIWNRRAKDVFQETGGSYFPLAFIIDVEDAAIENNFEGPFRYSIAPWKILRSDEQNRVLNHQDKMGRGRQVHGRLHESGWNQQLLTLWDTCEPSFRSPWENGKSFPICVRTTSHAFVKMMFFDTGLRGVEETVNMFSQTDHFSTLLNSVAIIVEPTRGEEQNSLPVEADGRNAVFESTSHWLADSKHRKKAESNKIRAHKMKRLCFALLAVVITHNSTGQQPCK